MFKNASNKFENATFKRNDLTKLLHSFLPVPSPPPGYLTPSESLSDDQISDSSYEADDSSEGSPNQEKARAVRRQAYSSYQVRELEREFATTSYPERETIQRLAGQTGLTAKQIKVL